MHIFEPMATPEPAPALFVELFDRHAAERGGENALMWDGGALPWRELHRQANGVAAALLASGGVPGQRVAIAGQSSADYLATLIGILKAGMSVVPLSTLATPDVEWRLLRDSGARLLFADCNSAEKLQSSASADGFDLPGRVVFESDISGWESYRSWLEHGSPDVQPPTIHAHDEFNVIYSSGTTGTPKGIVHDHLLRALQVQAFQGFGLSPQTLTLLTTALYTNYSLVA